MVDWVYRFLLLNLATILLPVEPATRIFRDIRVANLLSQLSGGAASHTGFAVEDQLLISFWFGEAEFILELVTWHEQSIGGAADWDVDGARDESAFIFGGFADICSSVSYSSAPYL